MKSPINYIAFAILLFFSSPSYSQESPTFFFSFVNAINSGAPTKLTVNGKPFNNAFPLGFYTGGMGFEGKIATLSVENGDLPRKEVSVPLGSGTSPIVIAYLKVENTAGNQPPKKSIEMVAIPCMTAEKGNLRAVYVGNTSPVSIEVRNARDTKTSGTKMELRSGVPVNVPIKGGPLEFLSDGNSITSHDAEGKENYLLVFYAGADGSLSAASALDMVFQ